MQEIVGKIFFDNIALVAAAHDEIGHAVSEINFHDVPDQRFATDFNHGFRLEMGFFGNTRSESARQNDSFHLISSFCDPVIDFTLTRRGLLPSKNPNRQEPIVLSNPII